MDGYCEPNRIRAHFSRLICNSKFGYLSEYCFFPPLRSFYFAPFQRLLLLRLTACIYETLPQVSTMPPPSWVRVCKWAARRARVTQFYGYTTLASSSSLCLEIIISIIHIHFALHANRPSRKQITKRFQLMYSE